MERTRYYPGTSSILESCHGYVQWLTTLRLKSLGWEHYEVHEPEPHILLFK